MENNVLKAKIRALKPTINYDFVIYWKNKDGIHGYNVTEECFTETYATHGKLEVDYRINKSAGSYPEILLAINCYDDILEIAQIECDTHRVKEKETREIKYHTPHAFEAFNVGRLYLVKDDINVYDEHGNIVNRVGNETINSYLSKMIKSIPTYYIYDYLLESIKTWWGSSQYGDETIGYAEFCIYNINKFFNYRIKYLKNKGNFKPKKKSEVEEIFEKPLKEYNEFELNRIYDVLSGNARFDPSHHQKLYIVEDIDDNWTVIRGFAYQYSSRYTNKYCWKERIRTFISDKACISYGEQTYNTQWTKMCFNSDIKDCGYSNYPVYGFYESKCKRLKYLVSLLENDKMNLGKFVAALRYPLIEQGVKSGYEFLCHRLISDGAIKANCKKIFKEYNPKAKSFVELLGINKYQAKAINSFLYGETIHFCFRTNLIEWLKTMLGEDYIHADEKSSTEAIQIYDCMIESTYSRNPIPLFCPNNLPIEKRIWFIKRVYRRAGEQGLRLIRDAINVYSRIPAEERIEFDYDHFNELQDIEHWHNTLVEMDLRRKNEIEAKKLKELEKKREKVDKERKNWEYEDEMVIIRLPKTAYEIKEEGALLHHCVGGYVDDHMRGDTTIMFLRDKKDPQKPLCTIEINNGRVRQIHLKYNAWLGTRPEYIPSVMRWLKQNDFKCADEILLSTATHYSSYGARWVSKPTID